MNRAVLARRVRGRPIARAKRRTSACSSARFVTLLSLLLSASSSASSRCVSCSAVLSLLASDAPSRAEQSSRSALSLAPLCPPPRSSLPPAMSQPSDGSHKRARLDGDGGSLQSALAASVFQSQMAAYAAVQQQYHSMPATQATSYPSMSPPAPQQTQQQPSHSHMQPPPQPQQQPQPHYSSHTQHSAPLASPSPSPPPSSSSQPAPPWMAEVPSFLDSLSAAGGAGGDEPTIPDEVVAHLLERSGANLSDPALVRLVGLTTHHFLYDLLTDARQIQRLRTKDKKDHTAELMTGDLAMALQQQGITIGKPEFIADNVFAGGMLNVADAVITPQANLAPINVAKKERAKK